MHHTNLLNLTRLAAQMQFRFPQFVPTPLSQLITNASPEGIALMQVKFFCRPQMMNALRPCNAEANWLWPLTTIVTSP